MKTKTKKYLELTKIKVTLLNLLVGVTCFVLATFPAVNWVNLAVFCVMGYLAAGGCGVLNSVYDQDLDSLMPRTSKRAIPSGYATTKKALALGSVMVGLSISMAYFYFNALTTLMIVLGAVFYLFLYTVWLKRITPWNVVIGGFAGCFAALSGWTAAANTLNFFPLMVAMLDFLWTPGHLWGLAIKKVKEYSRVGIPMLPVTIGLKRASRIVFSMNILTVAFSLFPLSLLTGPLYLAVAVFVGGAFIIQNRGLIASSSEAEGFKVFLASMPYLLILMLALIVDKIIFV